MSTPARSASAACVDMGPDAALGTITVRDPSGLVVHDGRLSSLRRFKEDAREVTSGYECGLSLESYQDVKVGDVVEAYDVEQVARRLGPPAGAKGAQAAERTA